LSQFNKLATIVPTMLGIVLSAAVQQICNVYDCDIEIECAYLSVHRQRIEDNYSTLSSAYFEKAM
jgi:hypothetical protein